jgi:hypothetical protein
MIIIPSVTHLGEHVGAAVQVLGVGDLQHRQQPGLRAAVRRGKYLIIQPLIQLPIQLSI